MNRCALLLLAGLGACLSPTLPLPPPDEPENITADANEAGVFRVSGLCTPGSLVLVQNLATGLIWGLEDDDADGRYSIRVDGELCDPAEVSEIVGSTTSDTTFFILESRVNGLPQGECE